MSQNNQLTLDLVTDLVAYKITKNEVINTLQSHIEGLSEKEAADRIESFGPNKLKQKKSFSIISLFISQFTNFLVVLLVCAGVFSILIGEKIDAYAIFAIILLNALLGFTQEYKAEKSLESLKHIETLKARVIRDGEEKTIEAARLVPGDIILLHEGEKIPADARLLECFNLEVDESMLTGESVPAIKEDKTFRSKIAVADQINMVFSGTNITKGRAKAIVILTGMETQIGKIAQEIQEAPNVQTPLQKALGHLGKIIGVLSLGLAIPGLTLGVFLGRDPVEMVMLAISLAVSAIPEGLPIVVTIALALGIKKMTKINVLVRKLSTAESLGGTDVICSDKTGTITHNQMTVTDIVLPKAGCFEVTGKGYNTEGKIKFNDELCQKFGLKNKPTEDKALLKKFIKHLILSSDATLGFGDPTERALITLGRKANFNELNVRNEYPRIDEQPFDSTKKYMTVVVKNKKANHAIIKGAPEIIFDLCKLSQKEKNALHKINDTLTSQGLRVLALASAELKTYKGIEKVKDYKIEGLVGMYDPPREEVPEAIKVCAKAGIRVVMITGDHKKTAMAIAKKIGLKFKKAVEGTEIDEMEENEFNEVVKKVNIFARVSPRHKVRILTALQEMGHQVAMTGDGVNDAPAVKRADVGIAVGSATDLTKGISDMILLDDDFSTIPKAIKEGRRIFFNIKKFVRFLLCANFDEILEILTSIALSLPLSLLPIHILWINLATDSLPALALATDVAEDGIMDKKPYQAKKEIMRGVIPFAALAGFIDYFFTFGLFIILVYVAKLPVTYARTINLTTTILFEMILVFSIRSEKSAFKIGLFTNKLLWLAISLSMIAQLFVVYHPLGNQIFKTVPIHAEDWIIVLLFASSGFIIIEFLKWIQAKFPKVAKYIPIS